MKFLRNFLEPLSPGLYIFQTPVTLQVLIVKKCCNNSFFFRVKRSIEWYIWLFNLSMLNFWWFGAKSRDFIGQNRGVPPLGFRWKFSMLLLG